VIIALRIAIEKTGADLDVARATMGEIAGPARPHPRIAAAAATARAILRSFDVDNHRRLFYSGAGNRGPPSLMLRDLEKSFKVHRRILALFL